MNGENGVTHLPQTCPSCGAPFKEHLGLIGTCRERTQAVAEINRLRGAIESFQIASKAHRDEVARLKALIRSVIDGKWEVTSLQEAIGDV